MVARVEWIGGSDEVPDSFSDAIPTSLLQQLQEAEEWLLDGVELSSQALDSLSVVVPTLRSVTLRNLATVGVLLSRLPAGGSLETIEIVNCDTADLWWGLRFHPDLHQLILNELTLSSDDDVFLAASLQDLHVVLTEPVGSIEPINKALRHCTNLSTFTWIHQDWEDNSVVPQIPPAPGLFYLTLEGAGQADLDAICDSLLDMTRLKTLRLRNLGFHDDSRLVEALRHSRPPLEWIDLRENLLDESVVDLLQIHKVLKNLKTLILDDNELSPETLRQVVELLANKGATLDFSVEDNPANLSALCLELAASRKALQSERDRLTRGQERSQLDRDEAQETARRLMGDKTSLLSEVRVLENEVDELRAERDALIKSFGLMGVNQFIHEYRETQFRLEALEQAILGGGGGSSPRRSVSRRFSSDEQWTSPRGRPSTPEFRRSSLSSFESPVVNDTADLSPLRKSSSSNTTVKSSGSWAKPKSPATTLSHVQEHLLR